MILYQTHYTICLLLAQVSDERHTAGIMSHVDPLVAKIVNIVDPALIVGQWVVFAITVSRLYQKDVFGEPSKQSRESANKSSSLDDAADAGSRSRSNTVQSARDKSVRGTVP